MYLEFIDNTEQGELNYIDESRIKTLNKLKQWCEITDESQQAQVWSILMRKQEVQKWRD